jgi:hypothetical protein
MKTKFKKLIRKLKYYLGKKEIIYSKSVFGVDDSLIFEKDVAITICYYDYNSNMYGVIVKKLNIKEC